MKYYKNLKNQIFSFEIDGSQDYLINKDMVEITLEEVKQINENQKNDSFDKLNYAEKRKLFYPTIENQLDTLYHGGYDVWKETIETVKNKFPKT
jgi:hypothetical protein